MKVKLTVYRDGQEAESYIVPDGSWVQFDSVGSQHASAVLKPTLTFARGDYKVICEPAEAVPEIPPDIAKLLNSRDKKWGRDGYEWMGCHREKQGGTLLERYWKLMACPWKRRELPLAQLGLTLTEGRR